MMCRGKITEATTQLEERMTRLEEQYSEIEGHSEAENHTKLHC